MNWSWNGLLWKPLSWMEVNGHRANFERHMQWLMEIKVNPFAYENDRTTYEKYLADVEQTKQRWAVENTDDEEHFLPSNGDILPMTKVA